MLFRSGQLDDISISKFSFKRYWRSSIRNRIQATIIFVSVFSFAVIGIATILFFYDKYESSNKDKLARVIHIMEKEVDEIVDRNLIDSDSLNHQEIAIRNTELKYAIKKIADIHGVDANLYDIEGNLIAASLELPYSEGVVSAKIDPVAYHHLHQKKEIQFIQNEKIGNLEFTSMYIPVSDKAEIGRAHV